MLNALMPAGRMGLKMDSSMNEGDRDVPKNIKRLLRYLHANSQSNPDKKLCVSDASVHEY
jgi:hypothetical protein